MRIFVSGPKSREEWMNGWMMDAYMVMSTELDVRALT